MGQNLGRIYLWCASLGRREHIVVMDCTLRHRPYYRFRGMDCLGQAGASSFESRNPLCGGSHRHPYLFPYDFCILSIAVAFLVYDGLSRGFLLGERTTILICFFSLFLFLGAFAPTGSVVCAVMLFLIALRIVAYRGDALAVPLPSRAEVDHPPL